MSHVMHGRSRMTKRPSHPYYAGGDGGGGGGDAGGDGGGGGSGKENRHPLMRVPG